MRKLKFAVLLAALMAVGGGKSYAHDIEVANADGVTIYYNFISLTELEVTYQGNDSYYSYAYAGKVVIPESVAYEGNTYFVTSIGERAFWDCERLIEMTIPNSVTSIGSCAFFGCGGLTEVTIPNSVTYIGDQAFAYCKNLTELIIPNSVTSIDYRAFGSCTGLTEVTIPCSVTFIGANPFSECKSLAKITVEDGNPNYDSREDCNAIINTNTNELISGCKNTIILGSVTSIGEHAFWDCTGLTELTIPTSVTSIDYGAFLNCRGLTELTIPNSVTSIGTSAFHGCSGLTEVTIPSSVTSIGINPFEGCDGLEKITVESGNPNYDSRENCNAIIKTNSNELFVGCKNTIIPNSVTSIGEYAFAWCFGLTELTIPSSVTSIGRLAFRYCSGLTTLYSLNTTPPTATQYGMSAFDDSHYTTVNVYVPEEALDAYQNIEVWKNFQKLQGIEAEKCATPTIHYANNKLTFKCETEGVRYESTITDTDIASYSNDEIDLSVTYTVTVYATKEGYEDSDVATATLCWIDVEPKTEGTTDDNTAVQQISANLVLIQTANGQITVTGLTDGTTVAVYDLSGQQVGTATSTGGQATVSTTLTTGTAAIVKMGDNKSVKIAVK